MKKNPKNMSIQITTEQIKELRDSTGISVMQCKHALEEAEGDMKKALAILKKTSSDIALKKGSREVKDGAVTIKLKDLPAQAGKKAVLVSLLCETDFVAMNEDFKHLAHEIALQVAAMNPKNVKELLKTPYIRDAGLTIEALVKQTVAKVGENIIVARFSRMSLGE
ncbi:MAG: Elongation factor Ts [Candidatus Nomurabacteria bacterium GW2011_GWF1_42_40]|nr:MAG: Elongation factor Ts [Candidatus Nomurabacteria bacterium GW2011_GWF1_42_40]